LFLHPFFKAYVDGCGQSGSSPSSFHVTIRGMKISDPRWRLHTLIRPLFV
jgi:hypothetical protein